VDGGGKVAFFEVTERGGWHAQASGPPPQRGACRPTGNTSPTALFVVADEHNSPIPTLAGRRVLIGYAGWLWTYYQQAINPDAGSVEYSGRVVMMSLLGGMQTFLGPILGGWLIQVASWHWIFLINAPIGLIAVLYAWRVLPRDTPEPSESFDFLGMALMSPGLAFSSPLSA